VAPAVYTESTDFLISDMPITTTATATHDINYIPIILWSIYGFGVLIFLLKFCRNLNHIISRIQGNPKLKSEGFTNVLVSNLKIPHTFFSYIFYNKYNFEHNTIPREVLVHEQAHARQKHSVDIILVELLQIIFWFNPLIYLIKRDVKLNHEFLADRAVIDKGIKPATYQTLLLAFSSNAEHQELANAINYSSIKKRFTVMNTHTSKRSIWMRSVLLLPVLAILLYGFTEREQVIRESSPPKIIELYLNEDGTLLQQNEAITFKAIEALYRKDSELQVSVNIFPDANVTIGKDIASKLRAIGIKNITICTSRVAEFQGTPQDPITPKQLAEYNKLAKYYNTQNSTNQIVKQKDVERLEYFYSIMSDSQKASAAPFPTLAPPPPAPPKTPVTVIKSELTWISLNRKGQILLNDKLGTLTSVEAEFKNIQKNKSASRDIVFRYDKDAPKSSISKVNKLINAYNLVNIYNTLPPPPPPPLPPRVKKGESSHIPPPPPKQTNHNPPTAKEIIAYNAYAKKITQQTVDLGQAKWIAPISEKDLVHFTNIYNRMTEKQRNAAEPFPNILPPPPPAPPKKQ
jgi:biopolymer transport protein ExbD